jgi:hypothetical protein
MKPGAHSIILDAERFSWASLKTSLTCFFVRRQNVRRCRFLGEKGRK